MTDFRNFGNIHQMLIDTIDNAKEQPAYRWFGSDGELESVTWKEFYDQVRQVSASLIALGIQKGDKVNILSYSCYRWVLSDLALATIGTVSVGIYQTLPADDCKYIIDHSDAVLAFVQDEAQLEKMRRIQNDIPNVRQVVLFSGHDPDDDWVLGWEEFLHLGKDISADQIDRMAAAVAADDIASIVYTSGTTGIPKGVMLTHDNVTFTAQSVEKSVYWKPGDHVFLFLPLAHIFAKTAVFTTLLSGCTLTFSRSIDSIASDLMTAKPHWFPSVPRIFEKVHSKIEGQAKAKGGAALKIFNWAVQVGLRVGDCKLERRSIPPLLALKYKLATRLVFRKIQKALGGRVRWCISGAAPLNPEIGRFFHAAGILIVEGIGMTENTSFSNLNRFDNYRFGWVGPPGPGIEQKVSADGEVWFRGRNVMKGYYKMPEDTAATITEDGWLKTGDLGEIDAEDFLKITGRQKEIIVTSGGKNIAHAKIEGCIVTSRYINQVFVIGDRRNYLTALVTLDPENIGSYARTNGIQFNDIEELADNPDIVNLIEREVKQKNTELASFETIKKICIVPEFTVENGLLTPTMKLKRNRVAQVHADCIDAMYAN